MKNKTETKEVLDILKTINLSSNGFYSLPIGSLKKYKTIKVAWDNCENFCELLVFKLLCAGPQNKNNRKKFVNKVKLIFKEVKQIMKVDIKNIPEWLRHSNCINLDDVFNEVETSESDILQHLKREWDDEYIYALEYIDSIPGMNANIVKKHLSPPTMENIRKLIFYTINHRTNRFF